ncbi:hypothetical protein [Pseudobutyrivibrio xylanivorans]|uniref:PA14 domain-containing protein n=1 Tax=Pseudobutyrivibrio xylanivorans TaxID=185007 RepID=A0A5P6VLT6_PSEXY|nr:hypothetical protein [Pseudobutyrivibrio xylanivorans]QFJ53615.1 hypothetical protein FXF36_01390 [Pseudobutyrivibrio xylanivorans]
MIKKIPTLHKMLALFLALILFASTSFGVYAEGDGGALPDETTTENTGGNSSGETKQEVDTADESTGQTGESATGESKEVVEENGDTSGNSNDSDTNSKDNITEEDNKEKAEADSEKTDSDASIDDAEKEDSKKADSKEEDSKEEDSKVEDSKEKDSKEKDSEKDESDEDYSKKDDAELDEEKDEDSDEIEEQKQEDKSFEKSVGDYKVSVFVEADTFEKDTFEFTASEYQMTEAQEQALKEAYSIKRFDEDELVAIDMTFTLDGEVVQPKKNVEVKVTSLGFTPDAVAHFPEEGSIEKETFTAEGGVVTYDASSFSPFVLFSAPEPEATSGGVLYGSKGSSGKSPYGYAETDEEHLAGVSTIAEAYDPDRYAVKLIRVNSEEKHFSNIAPSDTSDNPADWHYYIYSSENDDTFKFHFEAPENYYINYVGLGKVSLPLSADNIPTVENRKYTPVDYARTFDVELTLKKMGGSYAANYVVVCLNPIPVQFDDNAETTIVNGAQFINYENDTTAFGDSFLFTDGKQYDGTSNYVYYNQVWQGLASSTYDTENGIFNLKDTSGKNPIPTYKSYKDNESAYDYISDYQSNVGVQFRKDMDGYWTIDSDSTRYEIKDNVLVPTEGERQFRPFGETNHYAMVLPMTFTVNSTGKDDNGNDMIFRFSGDDDVYVYVDGKLVLDLGGIHDAIKGQINFQSGDILIQGDYDTQMTSSVDGSVYKKMDMDCQNLYTTLGTTLSGFANDEHKLTVIYFERGKNLSNCRISYNFNRDEEPPKTGKLNIIKTLLKFVKPLGKATFVFEVSYRYASTDYSYVFSYEFDEAGTKNDLLIDVPAGIEVTVKEVYEGASYKSVGDTLQKVSVDADETKTVKFVNTYDGRTNIGTSMKNVFSRIVDQVVEQFGDLIDSTVEFVFNKDKSFKDTEGGAQ